MAQKDEQKQLDEQMQVDEQMMRKALDEARQALAQGEVPIGAVIVCKGRVVARAHNLTETLCDVTAHAEMQAITAAANMLVGKDLTECTLYVTVAPCAPAHAVGRSWGALFMVREMRNGATNALPQTCCMLRPRLRLACWKRSVAN